MCIGIGPWPWPDRDGWDNVPAGDEWTLRRWLTAPYLAYVWHKDVPADWIPASWAWLSDHGWEECLLRLWFPGDSDHPTDLLGAEAMIDGVFGRVNDCIRAGGDDRNPRGIWVYAAQIDNEGNLEHRTMSPLDYAKRIEAAALYWKRLFPTVPLALGALAQWEPPADPAGFDRYYAELKPVIAEYADYQAAHFYWGKHDGDTQPGYKGSPEWLREQIPGKDVVITECGNAAVQHDIRDVLLRWTGYPWLRSYHLFVLSSEGHPKWNITQDTGNVLNDLIREWRRQRAYPRTAPVAPPSTGGNFDAQHLVVARSLANRIRKRVETASAAIGGIDSDAQEALDRLVMAGLPRR